MDHGPHALLATLVVAILLAFAFGAAARAARLPALVGYLVAGVAVGPHTPGFVADGAFTTAMAEVGVALLLFGVGLHFRARDLLAVWRVAVPGALLQIGASLAVGRRWAGSPSGWRPGPSLAFGLALAISSTVVATRTLEARGPAGRGGVAPRPRLAGDAGPRRGLRPRAAARRGRGDGERRAPGQGLPAALAEAAGELLLFLAVMALVGRPRPALGARPRGADGIAGAVHPGGGRRGARRRLRGVRDLRRLLRARRLLRGRRAGRERRGPPGRRRRHAHDAHLLGAVLRLGRHAARPRRADGPARRRPGRLLAVPLGVGGTIFVLLLGLRVRPTVAGTVAGAMSQIGEFSFLLSTLAIRQGVLPPETGGPILAAAFGSIILTPLALRGFEALGRRLEGRAPRASPAPAAPDVAGHAVLVGAGRVGRTVLAALRRHGLPVVVLEEDRRRA
jgi:CPA2 family monovalent cation:H+ antiporter-2